MAVSREMDDGRGVMLVRKLLFDMVLRSVRGKRVKKENGQIDRRTRTCELAVLRRIREATAALLVAAQAGPQLWYKLPTDRAHRRRLLLWALLTGHGCENVVFSRKRNAAACRPVKWWYWYGSGMHGFLTDVPAQPLSRICWSFQPEVVLSTKVCTRQSYIGSCLNQTARRGMLSTYSKIMHASLDRVLVLFHLT